MAAQWRRFQIRLSTMLVLVGVAGGLLFANLRPVTDEVYERDETGWMVPVTHAQAWREHLVSVRNIGPGSLIYKRIRTYGWPLVCDEYWAGTMAREGGWVDSDEIHNWPGDFEYRKAACNALVGLLLLAIPYALLERKRRPAPKTRVAAIRDANT